MMGRWGVTGPMGLGCWLLCLLPGHCQHGGSAPLVALKLRHVVTLWMSWTLPQAENTVTFGLTKCCLQPVLFSPGPSESLGG